MKKISKHQQSGKHSLDYDIIFKGKKEEITEDEGTSTFIQETFQYDPSSMVYEESYNNENYQKQKKIKERVFQIISEKTEVNLNANRRKPSKVDFNKYFVLLKKELQDESFTNVEIFNELAVYFSDNLFTMFKLLDNRWRNLVIKELEDHIGKVPDNSKTVNHRNLKEGSEIEFIYYDEIDETEKQITGVILDYDDVEELYKVDSYENIYFVEISEISKILNNTKFRYNLNKLNNIDFL